MYMKGIIITYLIFFSFDLFIMPFVFGQERPNYSAKLWLFTLIYNIPLAYILISYLNK